MSTKLMADLFLIFISIETTDMKQSNKCINENVVEELLMQKNHINQKKIYKYIPNKMFK